MNTSLSSIAFSLLFLVSCFPKSGVSSGTVIKAEEIISTISDGKNILLQDKTIVGNLDFTQLKGNAESESVVRVQIPVSVTFIHCRFKGEVKTYTSTENQTTVCTFSQNLTFSNCNLEDEVTIRENTISGKANFSSSIFEKKTSFEGTRFMSEAFFTKCNFQEEARFQNCFFAYKANWLDVVFKSLVSFQNAVFNYDAQFSSAKFMDYADFSVCMFNSHGFFNYAKFYSQAIFNNSSFRARFEMVSAELGKNTELKRSLFYGTVKLNQLKANGNLVLDNSVFLIGIPETAGWVKGDDFKLSTTNAKFNPLSELKAEDLN